MCVFEVQQHTLLLVFIIIVAYVEDPEWSFRYKNNTLFGAVARTKLQVAPCNRGRKLNLQGVET